MKYGYTRVSTDDQTPALQLAALKKAGCKTVFKGRWIVRGDQGAPCPAPLSQETPSRRHPHSVEARPLRPQFARPHNHARRPQTPGVKFRSLTEHIDTDTPTGRAMWQMIGLLAELERSLISERTRAGVNAAKRRGVKFGGKRKLTPEQLDHARELIDKGDRDRQGIADLFKVSRTTLYRALA